MPLVGGWSAIKDADDTVHSIISQLKAELEGKLNRCFDQLTPIAYKTQIVNGTNYLIKAKVSDDEHIHIRAHRPIRGEATLVNYKEKISPSDELTTF